MQIDDGNNLWIYNFNVDPNTAEQFLGNVNFDSYEYELNRGWIWDDSEDDPVGEMNFIVPMAWLEDYWSTHQFSTQAATLENFLDCYEPEIDGDQIYQAAVDDNVLIDEFTRYYNI